MPLDNMTLTEAVRTRRERFAEAIQAQEEVAAEHRCLLELAGDARGGRLWHGDVPEAFDVATARLRAKLAEIEGVVIPALCRLSLGHGVVLPSTLRHLSMH